MAKSRSSSAQTDTTGVEGGSSDQIGAIPLVERDAPHQKTWSIGRRKIGREWSWRWVRQSAGGGDPLRFRPHDRSRGRQGRRRRRRSTGTSAARWGRRAAIAADAFGRIANRRAGLDGEDSLRPRQHDTEQNGQPDSHRVYA